MFSELKERLKYFFFDVENDWEIGIANASVESFLKCVTLPQIRWMSAPRHVFWADPFGVMKDDKYYIFYEEFKKAKGYGTINCMALDDRMNIVERKVIIDRDYHCSFPYIFEYDRDFYMLPETIKAGKLSLYKATCFPFEWKEEKVLLNIPCVDSILFCHQNFWWLLYCKADIQNENSVLYLRKSDKLLSDWRLCPELIIQKTDYNTRNGGIPFTFENELYRIAQNCTERYGQSIVINKINRLSETDFQETPVKEIKLEEKGITGFHTLTSIGNRSLVDRKCERQFLKSPKRILKKISGKLNTS